MYDLIVIGGGAAGFFAALTAAETLCSRPYKRAFLELGRLVLEKVRISGGGRCNVTHAAFEPKELVKAYPRGQRELLGPFHHFAPGDTMHWFEKRGVPLKIEEDGRVFPVSDSSASIINALSSAAKNAGVEVHLGTKVQGLKFGQGHWTLHLAEKSQDQKTSIAGPATQHRGSLSAKQVMLATGSTPSVYKWVAQMGIPMVSPVPSLFSFNVPLPSLHALQGLSLPDAEIRIDGLKYLTKGSLLITHWGLSGPAVLKMSALAAIELQRLSYKTGFRVSWTGHSPDQMLAYLIDQRSQVRNSQLGFDLGLGIPKRLWQYLLERAKLSPQLRWAELRKEQLVALASAIGADHYQLQGQTRFKEEFVTAGGIDLKAIDFKRFAVKAFEGLYAAGELLNIDGITGGFNFQAAWTGGYLAGKAIAARLLEA